MMVGSQFNAYISQFKDNIFSLLEQKEAKLRPVFGVEMAHGETHFFERLGNFSASEITGRLENSTLQDPAHTRRMAAVRRYHASTYLDDLDKFKMLIDPTSEYSVKLARAHGRNFDDVVIGALLGNAATGQAGSGSQAFANAAADNVIAHGSAGLTVDKLNQALRVLESHEVDIDRDELVLIVGPLGKEDLYGDTNNRMTSFDFMKGKPLDGDALSFRGIQIITSNRIPADASADPQAILCTKDSLKVAMAQDMVVKVAERPDLNFAHQISTYMMFGAVRMDEDRVVAIVYQ